MVETSVLVSALAGAGSFFSPCILPIVPAFISYLSGTTLSEVQNTGEGSQVAVKRMTRLNIFLNTVYFVLGFSLVFAVLGVIFNSVLANVGTGFQGTLQSIGGVVIVAFGAYLVLATKFRSLNFEKRMTKIPRFKTSYITSFVFGAAFASGWTPCVGPILGSTLTLAATSPGAAYNSLLAYALGLGIPFLVTGAFFSQATGLIRRMVKYLKYFNPIMGAILIVLGILVFTNQLSVVASFPLANEIVNLERGI
ncbi:MAG: cytochrome c biogenesis CcdA family protein [Nitrososphaera sp.]|uniref:cytochrome c biogenesis CcdA family protein n=1 Tax=Nitrososphaera sp. TaxID=1971748 RepID=UPI003D6FFD5E